MADEIINRVAQSKLVTFDLEDFYPKGERMLLDIKDWLHEGLILKEKDFRNAAKSHGWSKYEGAYVAMTCSSDAVIPGWAYMLLSTYLRGTAKKVVVGDFEILETVLYTEMIKDLDVSDYKHLPVIIKGCSRQPVPPNAYILLINKLQTVAKSIMYGEACSSVPLFKK